MLGHRPNCRVAALLSCGALAVHELRYLLAGSAADTTRASAGHAYLMALGPLVALALAFAFPLAMQVAARRGVTRPRTQRPPLASWLLTSLVLLGIFVVQESVEAGLTAGRSSAFSHGGWFAVPLAFAVGALVAFAQRGVRAAADELAAPQHGVIAMPPLEAIAPLFRHTTPRFRRARSPLARRLAGRAPPPVAV